MLACGGGARDEPACDEPACDELVCDVPGLSPYRVGAPQLLCGLDDWFLVDLFFGGMFLKSINNDT